ncbi:MAG: hypothetical protein M4579_003937 [Chaenotheca gracillima]|nr:MAG: hypothetical protein M4579_003937 [Chaenotheca gracillima]
MDFETENAKEWQGAEPEAAQLERLPLPLRGIPPIRRGPGRAVVRSNARSVARSVARPPQLPPSVRGLPRGRARERMGRFAPITPLRPKALNHGNLDKFAFNKDTSGEADWRRRKQPDGVFLLPGRAQGMTNKAGFHATGASAKFPPPEHLEQIGFETGAFIELPMPSSMKICIWGPDLNVQAAKSRLKQWYSPPDVPATKEARWARSVAAPSDRKRKTDEIEQTRRATAQSFRQDPEKDQEFPSIGYFQWPMEGVRPEDFLGSNLEALDPFRTDHQCYITFDLERSMLKVLAYSQINAEAALSRIRTLVSEIITRSVFALRLYLIELPKNLESLQTHIKLEKNEKARAREADIHGDAGDVRAFPKLTGPLIETEERKVTELFQPEFAASNDSCMRRCVLEAFQNMHFYRGGVLMRAKFGTMSFLSYKKNAGKDYTIQEFCTMIREPKAVGEIIKDLGNDECGATFIAKCSKATDLLSPMNPLTRRLEETKPIHSASFELDCSKSNLDAVRLDLDFTEGTSGTYLSSFNHWFKFEKPTTPHNGTADLSKGRFPLDLNMIDIRNHRAWSLSISTSNSIDPRKITSQMTDFAKNVQFRPAGPEDSSRYPSIWYKFSDVVVKGWVERISYHYSISGSPYVLELTRYKKCRKDAKVGQTVSWEVTMFDPDWDVLTGSHVGLKIGQAGPWNPALEKFFGNMSFGSAGREADGFGSFLVKVREVSSLVNSFLAEMEEQQQQQQQQSEPQSEQN